MHEQDDQQLYCIPNLLSKYQLLYIYGKFFLILRSSYSLLVRTHERPAGSMQLTRQYLDICGPLFFRRRPYTDIPFHSMPIVTNWQPPLPYSTPSETATPPIHSPSPLVAASHLPFSNSGGAPSPLHRSSRWALATAAPTTFLSPSPWCMMIDCGGNTALFFQMMRSKCY